MAAAIRESYNAQEDTWKEILKKTRELESLNHFLAQGATSAAVDIFGTDWDLSDAIKDKLDMMIDVAFDQFVDSISKSDPKHNELQQWLKSNTITTNFTFDKEQTDTT